MALPSHSQSSVAVSSATMTGLRQRQEQQPRPSRMPSARRRAVPATALAWKHLQGLDTKMLPGH